MRVLSLLPSATEIVYALEAQSLLCGVSCDCDYPADVTNLPVVSATLLPIAATSSPGDIDQLVRNQLKVGDSIYSLNNSLIQELRPDMILAQDLCKVCAVPSGNVEEALDAIGCKAEVVSLDPHSLDDVLTSILLVGSQLGVSERAGSVVADLRSRLSRARSIGNSLSPSRVVALEWLDPPFTGGHWIPEMIELAGGVDLVGTPGASSRTLTWSEVGATAPDVIFFMPCGYDLKGAVEQLPALFEIEEFRATPAAENGNVFVTDSSAYFSRPGPRLIDGVEILGGCLHPDRFSPPPPSKALRVSLRDSELDVSAV